jgi:CBS domain-containing protein
MAVQRVESFMTKKVITLPKGAKISEAISLMARKSLSCIVITNRENRVMGVITERDLVKRVLQMGVNPQETEISYVMSTPVVTVTKDADIFDVMMIMQKHNFRRVVVTNPDSKKLIGLVTQTDLFKGIRKVQMELETINRDMRKELERLRKFTSLRKVSLSK